MEKQIDVQKMNTEKHQALVCMFFAMLPGTDERYKKRKEYWSLLSKKFGKKVSTYKHYQDSFDMYFPNREGFKTDRRLRSQSGIAHEEVYNEYKDYPIEVIEEAVEEIIFMYRKEESLFISMKCGYPDTVHAMINGEKNITIDGVYTLQDELTLNKIVFVTLGGDRGKKEVDWEPGFFGVAHIIKEPYDFGYGGNDKYFKFDICMDCSFGSTYKREDFLNYRDAFDARYIGPELTRDPSQAISGLEEDKAVAVIRAVLDKQPDMEKEFCETFSKEFMERVKGAVRVLVPTVAEYGESYETALETFREEMKAIEEITEEPIKYETGYDCKLYARNRIIFGAPGTGKSFTMNKDKDKLLETGGYYERVTFHPSYSYANFVGTYKPVSKKDNSGDEIIVYEYVPGPFMRVLVKALENSRANGEDIKPFVLLVEEINRANVAAVFGEVFQLLDRNSKNTSEYTIQPSEDIKKYLMDTIHVTEDEISELKIPDNMFIWATMNSADQGVFPMDTAFKRRWEFEYIGIDDESDEVKDYIIPIGNTDNRKYIRWNDIRTKINEILSSEQCKVNEDKLLGPFFMSKTLLESALEDQESEKRFVKAFESKVIMYLFEDVMKMRPQNIFRGHTGRMIFSDICADFEMNREKIFGIDSLEYIDK